MKNRFTRHEVARLATRAVRRIDTQGPRGTTMVTLDEIEALVSEVVILRAELAKATKEKKS